MSRHETSLTVIDADGHAVVVNLRLLPDTTWAEVRDELAARAVRLCSTYWTDQVELTPDTRMVTVPHGSVLGPQTSTSRNHDLLRLGCVEGPFVGVGIPLGARPRTVGRSPDCDLVLDDPEVSRRHLCVWVEGGRVVARDLGSTNGTDRPGTGPNDEVRQLRVGDTVRIGRCTLRVDEPRTSSRVRSLTIAVDRTPRRTQAPRPVEFTEPVAHDTDTSRLLLWIGVVTPVLMGLALAVWTRSLIFLALVLLAPLAVAGQHVVERRERRRDGVAHEQRLRRHRDRVDDALRSELVLRRETDPGLASALESIMSRDELLWHRRPGEHGWLSWRLGTGRVESKVTVRTEEDEAARPLDEAPVVVDLVEHRRVGVHGPGTTAVAAARSLLVQAVAWHSPADLRIVVLGPPDVVDGLCRSAPFLPHVGRFGIVDPSDPLACEAFLRTLPRSEEPTHPRTLVLDLAPYAATRLRELHCGPELLDVTVISFAGARSALPTTAGVRVAMTSQDRGEVDDLRFVPDLPTAHVCDRPLRTACAYRDPAFREQDEPDHLSAGIDRTWKAWAGDDLLSADATVARWRHRPRCTAVPIGSDGEQPVVLDLQKDGPHALVAGTTGSGKSELLQTWLTALAAANRPDELAYVLVDYKGGAGLRGVARFPHTVGVVTDLDAHLAERALVSLRAELAHREQLFADHGVSDLTEYQRLPDAPPLPRQVIVVDEFRVLAEELPEFVDGLVRLATVGRSLGVHLVLATQRPAGVVTPEIRANVNLRIALRVRDTDDSVDVIESAAAARISPLTPGRAYVHTGERLTSVQVAPVCVPAAGEDRLEVRLDREPPPPHDGDTVLDGVVDAVTAACRTLDVRPGRSPWLAPLADEITAAPDVGCTVGGDPLKETASAFAVVDRPTRRAQEALAWVPHRDHHLAVIGAARTGRTTAVRAILAAAVQDTGAQVHVVDGGRGLDDLARHPQVGTVVTPAEPERISRTVDHLLATVTDRQGAGDPTPPVVLVVDGWEVLTGVGDDPAFLDLMDRVVTLLRDGPSAGVYVVATGGTGMAGSRLLGHFRSVLTLRPNDPDDLAVLGVPRGAVPADMPPGRGLVLPDADVVQILHVRELPAPVPGAALAPSVRALPEAVSARVLAQTSTALGMGYDGAVLSPLHPGRHLAVVGRSGSGRTTVLHRLSATTTRRCLWVGAAPPRGTTAVADATELTDLLLSGSDLVVCVDDLESVLGTDVETALEEHLHDARRSGLSLVAALDAENLANSYSTLVTELRTHRSGLLLTTDPAQAEFFGLRAPHLDRPRPGAGFVVERGATTAVQVAR